MPETADAIIEEVISRFDANGDRQYGESVTQREHALQSATFAERDGQPDALVIACLLHDYGHLCHERGEDIADKGVDARHEDIGAGVLRKWFPPEVVEPGRLHVAAKRYLCTVDDAYFAGLSPASMKSLELQGGRMSPEEVQTFEAQPFFEEAIALRRYDDLGKQPGMATPDLEHFRPAIARVLADAIR